MEDGRSLLDPASLHLELEDLLGFQVVVWDLPKLEARIRGILDCFSDKE